MRLFVKILELFDAMLKAMAACELFGLLLGLCMFAIAAGVFLRIRHAAA